MTDRNKTELERMADDPEQSIPVRKAAADAVAEIARLREALTLIERLYYVEGKDAYWRASCMNGVAREAQNGNDLGHYHRIFPRGTIQEQKP